MSIDLSKTHGETMERQGNREKNVRIKWRAILKWTNTMIVTREFIEYAFEKL